MFTPEMMRKMEEQEALDYGEGGPKDRGAQARYEERKEKVPLRRLVFWWFVHNSIAHPLIGVLPIKPFFDFHNWTAKRIGSEVLLKSLK
jgi:hypothetical protein